MRSRFWSCLRSLRCALLCAGAVMLAWPAFAQEPGGNFRARAAAGEPVRVIVQLRMAARVEGRLSTPEVAAQRADIRRGIDEVLARLPAPEARRARRFATIPFFAIEVSAATLDRLTADPDVVSIEEDLPDAPTLAESVPLVGAPAAWSAGYSGTGWTVAILDTGVDKTHTFLNGKVVAEACYSNAGGAGGGITLCPGSVAASTSPGSGLPCSGFSGCDHGTHVAGIAAGRGATMSGVGRDAGILSIQVFTGFPAGSANCPGAACALSFVSDQVLGLERVLLLQTTYNIAAVNMSLGGSQIFTATCDATQAARKAAIDNLRSAGIATVIASGNGASVTGLSAPACISSAVSVGSSTKTDLVSGFSNTAPFLSLLAPGSSIESSVPGGGFATLSGTSMAAPHVAGAWALMKSRQPGAGVAEVLAALRAAGTPIVDSGNGLTFPRLQVDRAIAAAPVPVVTIDTPSNGGTVSQPFEVRGWAIDPSASSGTGVDAIHVYAFPSGGGAGIFLGAAPYGVARPDVGTAFGGHFTNSGFNLIAAGLDPGAYQIVAYAHSSVTGAFDGSASTFVTVQPPVSSPRAMLDTPVEGATVGGSFAVSGWALDTAAAGGTGVDALHVYAFPAAGGSPIFLGVAAYGATRPDVGSVFGGAFTSSGFGLAAPGLAPGQYTLVAYFRSTISGAFSSVARAITVRPPGDPFMAIDTPAASAGVAAPFHVAGWAIDRDAPAGPGVDAVHVWAFPAGGGAAVFLGAAACGAARPDVGQAFGSAFANSGYDLLVTSPPPGAYQIVVFARSTVTGTFNQALAVTVF